MASRYTIPACRPIDKGIPEIVAVIERELPGWVEEIMVVVRRGPGQDFTDLDIVTRKAIITVAGGQKHIGEAIKNSRSALDAFQIPGLSSRAVIGVVPAGVESRLLRRSAEGLPFDPLRFVTNSPEELIQYLRSL